MSAWKYLNYIYLKNVYEETEIAVHQLNSAAGWRLVRLIKNRKEQHV